MSSSRLTHHLLLPAFAAALMLAAGLLFYIQPMIGKMLLPRAGGAPAVWNVAMAFFQMALLAGYIIAHLLSRLPVRIHALAYLAALAGAWLALPLALPEGWQIDPAGSQSLAILLVLLQSAAIPFVALSLSAPTLQRLFASTGHPQARDPYFLYAASNLGSFVGLLAYPLLVEPLLPVSRQTQVWQVLFLGLLVLAAACWLLLPRQRLQVAEAMATRPAEATPPPPWRQRGLWVLLAFIPSSLTLGVTTYITTDVAATPLLWVLTLGLYLLTYILAFARRGSGLRQWALRWAPWFGAAALATQTVGIPLPWPVLFLHLTAFFVTALACHTLLSSSRPGADHLTGFYLCLSVGGALGGSFNAFLAPVAFSSLLEYPLVLLLALGLSFPVPAFLQDPHRRERVALALFVFVVLALGARWAGWLEHPLFGGLALGGFVTLTLVLLRRERRLYVIAASVLLVAIALSGRFNNKIFADRDFFGVVSVMDMPDPGTGQTLRHFLHGTTIHGVQIIGPEPLPVPQGYYAAGLPIGTIWAELEPQTVVVTGLGAGGLNCFAKPGQRFHFIEIDPLVVHAARGYFDFLSKCPEPEITVADGRLAFLADERRYDLVVLDAFSSDSLPAHLITREAFRLYLEHLNPGGAIAINISNRFFAMQRMLVPLAHELGLTVLQARSDRSDIIKGTVYFPTEWMVMAPDPATLAPLLEKHADLWRTPKVTRPVQPWTDDFSNLLSVLKLGES